MTKESTDKFELVPLIETQNAGDIAMVRAALDGENILFQVTNEKISRLIPFMAPARVLVRKDQYLDAKKVLNKFNFQLASFDLSQKSPGNKLWGRKKRKENETSSEENQVPGTFWLTVKQNPLALNAIILFHGANFLWGLYKVPSDLNGNIPLVIIKLVIQLVLFITLLSRINWARILVRVSYFLISFGFPFIVIGFLKSRPDLNSMVKIITGLIGALVWSYFISAFIYLGKKKIRKLFV